LVYSRPMKNILRPAITGPRHNAEHILHAERDARPSGAFSPSASTQ
jgi:hypothetical protein